MPFSESYLALFLLSVGRYEIETALPGSHASLAPAEDGLIASENGLECSVVAS